MIREIHNDYLTVAANEAGAELYSVRTSDGTEYIWQGSSRYWANRAMNIFPICGRLFGGVYTYKGKTYSMKCHGIARDAQFELSSESTENKLVFKLVGNDSTKQIYPFDFTLLISFELKGKTLICTNTVINTGDEILPFTTGGHPGFNVPLTKDLKFDDYYIDFGKDSAPNKLLFSDTCFDTGAKAPFVLRDGRYLDLVHTLFDNDAIFLADVPTTFTLASNKNTRSVTVHCEQVKYVGFWHTNRSDAPFVCIEPWLGLPSADGVTDDLSVKPEMIRLSPGESFDFSYDIIFN